MSAAQMDFAKQPLVYRYTPAWERATERVVVANREADANKQLPYMEECIDEARLPTGTYGGFKAANVLLNMFELAPNNGGKRVHVAVFEKRRLHPRTGKLLSLKGDQHYEAQDIKLLQSTAIFAWLKVIGRPESDAVSACGDGKELLFFNADEFTEQEVMRMKELKEPLIAQTAIDRMPSAYMVNIALAGTDIQLRPKDANKPLEMSGPNGHGLRVTTLDVLTAAVLWQPGHLDSRVGVTAKMGWQMYGNNKLMYNWATGVLQAGKPRFDNNIQQQSANWLPPGTPAKLVDCLRLLRPDPIDTFAPDARRELAKGIAVHIYSALNGRTYLRSDLWRPIHFTGVSRMSPTEPNPEHSSPASLVEDYLHRMSSMTGKPYNWNNLFAKQLPATDQQADVANDLIRNRLRRLPVYTLHSRRGNQFEIGTSIKRHVIFKLSTKNCDQHRFVHNGKDVSVTEYFKEMGINLVHHDTLPLVDVAQGLRGEVLMPMELLFIESHLTSAAQLLACKGRNEVPAEVTTSILRSAALPGAPRYVSLRAWTGAAELGLDETSKQFGYKAMINDKTNAKAMLLDCNAIEYGRNGKAEIAPLKGGWLTPRGAPYIDPKPMKKEWAIMLHTSLVQFWDKEIRTPFLEQMASTARGMGIPLEACPQSRMHAFDTVELMRHGLNNLKNDGLGPVRLVVVVMPRRDPLLYKAVKQWGDVQEGVATQCLLYATIKKSINRATGRVNQDTLYNLLLKMNGKMGGRNWTFGAVPGNPKSQAIVTKQRQTLYLGVDVRHPSMQRCTRHPVMCMETVHSPRMCPNAAIFQLSPEQNITADGSPPLATSNTASSHTAKGNAKGPPNALEKAFSFAAISGTYTKDSAASAVSVRVQPANTETLVNVKDSLMERINDYIAKTGQPPKRIVYLRDGVGESQQPKIVQEEWKALLDAVNESMRGQPAPLLVFVMAVKQHNLRMFDESADKGNVRMGTVLASNSGYVSNQTNEFFMVAHKALQGTAKPLRYVVLKSGYSDGSPAKEGDVTELDLIAELFPLHSMNARAQKTCMLPAPIKYAHLAAERANIHIADNWQGEDALAAQQAITVHDNSKHMMYWL